MVKIYHIDYAAVEGKSFLHRIAPSIKIIMICLLLMGIVIIKSLSWLLLIYLILLSFFFVSRIPKLIFSLTLYPLVFATLFIFISKFQLHFILLIFLKVLCGSTGIIILFSTTPYPKIFQFLEKFLPSIIVASLFITYRSVFILIKIFEETQHAIYPRGGFQWRNPWRSIVNISNVFGHLIIKGIDASENMYEAMLIRGFKNKIHYRG